MMRAVKIKIALGVATISLAPVLFWAASEYGRSQVTKAYTAPGLEQMTPEVAREQLFAVLPALLLVVYDAFARTDEDEIYDTLAVAADGTALETLYLERAGAMVDGGLTADQAVHEMRLIGATATPSGETLELEAQWEVIGTVGHSEHLHVRGNTYRANVTVAPVGGAWKITDFELTDIDRGTAGEFIPAERAWWN